MKHRIEALKKKKKKRINVEQDDRPDASSLRATTKGVGKKKTITYVLPDVLHVIPIDDDSSLNGIREHRVAMSTQCIVTNPSRLVPSTWQLERRRR